MTARDSYLGRAARRALQSERNEPNARSRLAQHDTYCVIAHSCFRRRLKGFTDIVPRNDAAPLGPRCCSANFVERGLRESCDLVNAIARSCRRKMETRLYVGNLSDDVSVDALRKRFADFGAVSSVHLATDRSSGRMRGYAFITMATGAAARSAMAQLNGAMFEDRPLRVNAAGDEREGARSKAANDEKPRVRITSQFRERYNMTYELDCAGVLLALKVFPIDPDEQAWRIEACTKGVAGADDMVVTASASTRALALQEVGRSWCEQSISRLCSFDWTAITDAMAAVRAI